MKLKCIGYRHRTVNCLTVAMPAGKTFTMKKGDVSPEMPDDVGYQILARFSKELEICKPESRPAPSTAASPSASPAASRSSSARRRPSSSSASRTVTKSEPKTDATKG